MTSVFSLPPIPTTSFFPLRQVEASSSRQTLPALPTVSPTYTLDDIDEYEWQGDKVLPGVVQGMEWAREPSAEHTVPPTSSLRKGKQREEVRHVGEGIWAAKSRFIFPDIDRLALEPGPPRGFKIRLSPSGTRDALFTLLDSDVERTPMHLPGITSEPQRHLSSVQMLPNLFSRSGLLQQEAKHVKWDEGRARYRFTARRLGQTMNEDLAERAQIPLRIVTAVERLDILTKAEDLRDRQTEDSPTVNALRYATRTYLSHARARLVPVGEAETSPRGVNSNLGEDEAALAALCSIWDWPLDLDSSHSRPLGSTNDILSHLYDALVASATSDANSSKTTALAYVLQHTSRPSFQVIAAWVGLQPDTSNSSTKTYRDAYIDIGITQHTLDSGSHSKSEYTFDPSLLPSFISPEVGQRIFEGGKSLRLLREASPGHPAAEHWDVPFTWKWPDEQCQSSEGDAVEHHMEKMRNKMEKWKDSLESRSATPVDRTGSRVSCRRRRGRIPEVFRTSASVDNGQEIGTSDVGEVEVVMPAEEAQSSRSAEAELPANAPPTMSSPDELAVDLILPQTAADWPPYLPNHILSLPLAHADAVNTALVTLLFDELHYTSHLDVLTAYWLGGDAAFSERVAAALFGVGREEDEREVGLGRRARTRARMGIISAAPVEAAGAVSDQGGQVSTAEQDDQAGQEAGWGIALGVGLNDRQRWPPGGSEMAYALRTTLVDAEISSAISADCTEEERANVWEKVQDTVSFAIRPLPQYEAQRKAWMDPQSVEALDFLFLAYSPPPTLSVLLPRAILDRYQVIHNHLLRFSRAQVVLRGMYRDLTRRPTESDPLSADLMRLATELRITMAHFVETSTRYMMDIAVGANVTRQKQQLAGMRAAGTAGKAFRASATGEGHGLGDATLALATPDDRPTSVFGDAVHAAPMTGVFKSTSVQALVDGQHSTLDAVMRSCLLGEDEQSEVAYDVLMRLLTQVLDTGKAIRCAVKGWTGEEAPLAALSTLKEDWLDTEARFTRAIQRVARSARDGLNAANQPSTKAKEKGVEMALREWLLRLDLYVGTARPSEAVEEA